MEKVADRHSEWIKMSLKFAPSSIAEDIVQAAYIRLMKYADADKIIFDDGRVNTSYVWRAIYSEALEFHKKNDRIRSKMPTESLDEPKQYLDGRYLDPEEEALDEAQAAWNRLLAKIDEEVKTWNFYEQKLFFLYKDNPFSLRQLGKEVEISWVSVHHTITKCKKIIKDKFWEDFEDYKNGDFHLI